jgi:hypothetical protein
MKRKQTGTVDQSRRERISVGAKGALVAILYLLFGVVFGDRLLAQDAQIGIAVPVTISGGMLDTGRARYADPSASSISAAFRLLALPQVKLGPHWYVYSALQLRSTPYFYEDAYDSRRQIKYDTLQAFVGYSRSWSHTALAAKLGKLSSAFGAFPLRYDDMANPLLDEPLQYNYLLLQPGSGENYGLTPVTLYGLPAAELDLSWRRVDTRFQLTTSNPYNPVGLFARGQYPQWTAGGGYTIHQGLRVGVSGYSGPWLSGEFSSLVPVHLSATDFPARAFGVDAQWARGKWNASGEWDRFAFSFPALSNVPTLTMGYVELKRIISPRWYAASRLNYQTNNHGIIDGIRAPRTIFPDRQYYEVAVGFRPDRFQLLKVGYEWASVHNGEPNRNNVFGIQFVTSFNGLSKPLR